MSSLAGLAAPEVKMTGDDPVSDKWAAQEAALKQVQDLGDTSSSVIVAGGGIAGLAMAVALHKVGIPALVLERNSELQSPGNALGMWPNAFRALEVLGCGDAEFRETFLLVDKAQMLDSNNQSLRVFDYHAELGEGQDGEVRCIRRSSLVERLARELPPEVIIYNCAVDKVVQTEAGAELTLRSGQVVPAKAFIGAEGINSPTAKWLGLPSPEYRGYSGIRGLAPAGVCERAGALQPDTFRMIMGRGARGGIVALSKEETYWFVALSSAEGKQVHDSEGIRAEALEAVRGWEFPMAEVIKAAPAEHLQRNRIYDRHLKPGKPFGRGCITVIGDAAHVSTPNLGQGGCAALEDAVELTRILRTAVGGPVDGAGPAFKAASPAVIQKALREYEVHRSLRTSALVSKAAWVGYIGQATLAPVAWLRKFMLQRVMTGKGFLSHVTYDCGTL